MTGKLKFEKTTCDSCGVTILKRDGLGTWQICFDCMAKKTICDCCGASIRESENHIKDETYGCWVCVECYEKLHADDNETN